MCITKTQILELDEVITKLNSFEKQEDQRRYLDMAVEDTDLFLKVLRSVDKKKIAVKREKNPDTAITTSYQEAAISHIFEDNSMEEILQNYSKAQLTDMYYAIYLSKPLSASNKERIAQSIRHYFHNIDRTRALLG